MRDNAIIIQGPCRNIHSWNFGQQCLYGSMRFESLLLLFTRTTFYLNNQSVPNKNLDLDFDGNIYTRAHRVFCSLNLDTGIQLTREELPDGHTLYNFDLSPDHVKDYIWIYNIKEIYELNSNFLKRQKKQQMYWFMQNLKTLLKLANHVK